MLKNYNNFPESMSKIVHITNNVIIYAFFFFLIFRKTYTRWRGNLYKNISINLIDNKICNIKVTDVKFLQNSYFLTDFKRIKNHFYYYVIR